MMRSPQPLRVALIAGTLGKGGAEKQLVYMVRALMQAGAQVRVYCATRGELYERALIDLGCEPIWFGKPSNPLSRVRRLSMLLREFRPHVIQSAHFYTNLYVALAARSIRCLRFGSLRNDAIHEVEGNGRWGPWLIRMPPALIANSKLAKSNAQKLGVKAEQIHVLPNVLDLDDFDRRIGESDGNLDIFDGLTVVALCRLVRAKRVDRFIRALAVARQDAPVRGIVIGDGPERIPLQQLCDELNLRSDSLQFLGWRNDVANILHQCDLLVISSDHEGFPNVLLEAMAAGIPAVSTPAGDAPEVIRESETGFVVAFDDVEAIARCIVRLANEPETRKVMGVAARHRVESTYSPDGLAKRMLQIYREAAVPQRRGSLEPVLAAYQ